MKLRNEFCSIMCMWKAGKNNRGTAEPAGHDYTQSQCRIAIFAECDVYSKFGEFLGMSRPLKLQSNLEKNNSFSFNYNRDLTGLQPARALIKCGALYIEATVI